MKRIISFVSIFVIFINLFAFPIPVKADGVPVPGYIELKEIQQDIENGDNRTIQDIWHVLQPIGSAVGVIMNPIQTIEFIRDIVDPVAQTLPEYPTSGSDTDKANYITNYLVNNTNINDNSKTYSFNQNARNLVNGVINQYISSCGFYYAYSYNIQQHLINFTDGDLYNAISTFCDSHESEGKIVFSMNYKYAYVIPNPSHLVQRDTSTAYGGRKVYYYDNSWNKLGSSNYNKYEYSNGTFNNINNIVDNTSYVSLTPVNNNSIISGLFMISKGHTDTYKVFRTLDDLKAETAGQSPYYINNTTYNNWNNTNGDYSINLDNSNHATYGDVQTYIDDHHSENETYPTPTQIEIYIEQVPAPTPIPTPTPVPTTIPDNPSGGGSVSGNTNNGGSASASATANNSGVNVTVNNNHNINFNVPGLSGNGIGSGTVSGNGNGSGGIFDWISDIGGVIGDFIKNVGQLIADVIKGITETITTVLEDIPNIISVLVEFVYGGLPDELKAIVTLGITTVIFVGVIKMMRK